MYFCLLETEVKNEDDNSYKLKHVCNTNSATTVKTKQLITATDLKYNFISYYGLLNEVMKIQLMKK